MQLRRQVLVLIVFTAIAALYLYADWHLQTETGLTQSTGVCDRTQQIQDAILSSAGSGFTCATITDTELAAVIRIRLRSHVDYTWTSLKAGDFDGLTGLVDLEIRNTSIAEFPAGIFDDLDSITRLQLIGHRFTAIDADDFAGLSTLRTLSLNGNVITSIAPDSFKDLTNLYSLELESNNLTTVSSGVFNGLGSLAVLSLNYNLLASIASGVFDPLVSLESIKLINQGQLPLNFVGQTEGSTLTSLPSATFVNSPSLTELDISHNLRLTELPADLLSDGTVLEILRTRDTGITSFPQVLIDSLMMVEELHMGPYLTAWPSGLVLPDTVGQLSVYGNDQFAQFPAGVIDTKLPAGLGYLTLADLELSATEVSVIGAKRNALRRAYFENTGLTAVKLTSLLNAWCDDDPMTDTTAACENWAGPDALSLYSQDLSDWMDTNASDIDDQRAAVQKLGSDQLILNSNMMSMAQIADLLANIPIDIEILNINQSGMNGLRFDFSVFTSMTNLYLTGGGIDSATLAYVINNLPPSIRSLRLNNNAIVNIPVFPSYPNLSSVFLHRNQIASLPDGAVDELSNLSVLALSFNELTGVPDDFFDSNKMSYIYLNNNAIEAVPAGLFDRSPNLGYVYLNDNELPSLPAGLFDNTPCLKIVWLHNNDLDALPTGIFADGQCIRELSIYGNDQLNLQLADFPNLLTTLRGLRQEPPPPTPTPTPTASPTPTPTATATATVAPTSTPVPTATATSTPVPTATATSTPVPTATATVAATSTPVPTATATSTPVPTATATSTPVPTATATVAATSTPVPTATATATVAPTSTPVPTATATATAAPTSTPVPTATAAPTSTPVPTAKATTVPTSAPVPAATSTPVPTSSASPTASPSPTPTATPTPTASPTPTPSPTATPSPSPTPSPTATGSPTVAPMRSPIPVSSALLVEIEPAVSGVVLSAGNSVVLRVVGYGRQDVVDNGMVDSVTLIWDDGDSGGSFEGVGREVVYTASDVPGRYTVSATVDADQCFGDDAQCRAEFEITVVRGSVIQPDVTAPVNPHGEIPETLTDTEGVAYAVFTPVDGGSFVGDGYLLSAGSGAVANGEYIGISMAPVGDASNVGKTWHRYTLGGRVYSVDVVDSTGATIADYALGEAASVCVPMPAELRANIADIVLTAMTGDGGMTVLSTRVTITPDGVIVCGNLSSLPADVAVGKVGSPPEIEASEIESSDEPLPDAGGAAPMLPLVVMLLMFGSLAVIVSSLAVMRLRRRR